MHRLVSVDYLSNEISASLSIFGKVEVKFSFDPIVLIGKLLALLAKNKKVGQDGQITTDKHQASKHSIRRIENILVDDQFGHNATPFSNT